MDAYKQLIQVPDTTTWKILLTYFLGQAAIMKAVPGKRFTGPLSPMGNTPVYKAHGLQCYAVSLALYAVLYYNGVFTGQLIYEQMGKLYCALVISAFIFCVFMWIKGHVAPTYVAAQVARRPAQARPTELPGLALCCFPPTSDEDSGSSGNPVMDFYWGMELYPHIFGFNVKHYISCRVSMTAWPLLLISYALAEVCADASGQIFGAGVDDAGRRGAWARGGPAVRGRRLRLLGHDDLRRHPAGLPDQVLLLGDRLPVHARHHPRPLRSVPAAPPPQLSCRAAADTVPVDVQGSLGRPGQATTSAGASCAGCRRCTRRRRSSWSTTSSTLPRGRRRS